MSRSGKGRTYFDVDKYNALRFGPKRVSENAQVFTGGDPASLRDVQVSRDKRRHKIIRRNVECRKDAAAPLIELDDQMELDFGLGEAPGSTLPPVSVKKPKRRYFVSVSTLSSW